MKAVCKYVLVSMMVTVTSYSAIAGVGTVGSAGSSQANHLTPAQSIQCNLEIQRSNNKEVLTVALNLDSDDDTISGRRIFQSSQDKGYGVLLTVANKEMWPEAGFGKTLPDDLFDVEVAEVYVDKKWCESPGCWAGGSVSNKYRLKFNADGTLAQKDLLEKYHDKLELKNCLAMNRRFFELKFGSDYPYARLGKVIRSKIIENK